MSNKEIDRSIIVFIVDFILLTFSSLLMHYVTKRTLILTSSYVQLLILIYVSWLFISFWFNKFQMQRFADKWWFIKVELKATVAMIYLVTLVVIIRGAVNFSQFHVFGTFVLLMILEISLVNIFSAYFPRSRRVKKTALQKPHISWRLAVADFVLFTLSYCLISALHEKNFLQNKETYELFMFLAGAWLLSAGVSSKFEKRHYQNFHHALWPSLMTPILLAGTMSVLVFAFKLFVFSRTQIFGSILVWAGFSTLLAIFYYAKRINIDDGDVSSLEQVVSALQQEKYKIGCKPKSGHKSDCRRTLADDYLKHIPELVRFVEKQVDLSDLSKNECVVLDTVTPYNIEVLGDASLQMMINLHKVNDFRRINRYFLSAHAKLQNGGYFIGCKEPIERVRQRFQNKYPELLAMILYTFHFIFFRIWPKLPFLKKLYFLISRGRNRVLSRAELFGRLGFCGFSIVAAREIRGNLYYIAQKVKTPSLDEQPSYGPLIKINKIGLGGKIIKVHKFRTMHPYSEYIQDYVFEKNQLAGGGKFKDDFRVTEWGKIMRALWLDELPQLYNFIRGDVTLVGVRALSSHYFSLYPKDVQELRIRFKPGLVPPFYADMPKKLDEIIKSEKKYLLKKQQHPVRTDLEYLGKAIYNILFKGARSR